MKKILILGGGFGGIRCALDCARKLSAGATITLIDRKAYHTFTPALYEIASAYQPSDDPFALKLRKAVTIPYGDIFEGKKINFIQAEIASVDLNNSHVVLGGGTQIDFDYLVFSLGSQPADFGITGVYDYTYQFKTTDDAVALHDKLEKSFQEAVQGKASFPIKFLIIGAGFTGIELAAELMFCAKKLSQRYALNRRSFSAVLLEAGPIILPMIKDEERKKIMSRLTDLGVVVMTNSTVENVLSDSIKLKTGQTVSGTAVVWTAGVQSNRFLATIEGLPLTDKNKVLVDENLRVKNSDKVFALGDCIEFIDPRTQKPVPGLAYHAITQAKVVASNITALMKERPLTSYKISENSWAVPVGGKFALVQMNSSFWVSGFVGWLIRLWIDARYFFSILSLKKASSLFKKDIILFTKND
jgi:NADH dehydrogenase